jgi:S1-C subfamily serine protease
LEVQADSPADKAGLKVNDVVVAINGRTVTGQGALIAAIRDSAPGDKVTITVDRDGSKKELVATLTTRPAE